MTPAILQGLLDEAAGKQPGGKRWPRFDYVEVRAGELVVSEPLTIDGGPMVDGSGELRETRGPGPRVNFEGTVIKADPNVDWSGKAVVEWCGASVVLNALNLDTSGCKYPPAHYLAGGLVATAGGGHSYTGGATVIRDAYLTGPVLFGGILCNNAEMVTIATANIRPKGDNVPGVVISRGWPFVEPSTRMSTAGHTQTVVNVYGGDIYATGRAPAIAAEGQVGQIMVQGAHLGTDDGPMFLHDGNVPAENVVIIGNRWESHGGLAATRWMVAPQGCYVAYNGIHRHGWPKPTAMWEIVCPDIIRAANIRTEGNTTSAGRLIKHRQTWPTAEPV